MPTSGTKSLSDETMTNVSIGELYNKSTASIARRMSLEFLAGLVGMVLVNRLDAKFEKLVLLASLDRPVTVGSANDHAAHIGKLVKKVLDGVQPNILVVN